MKKNYEEITKKILTELFNIDNRYFNNEEESVNEQNRNDEIKGDKDNNDLENNW